MSTRGIYGFYIDGKFKVAYNHYDSYPSDLGYKFASFVKHDLPEDLEGKKEFARSLVPVNESEPIGKKHFEEFNRLVGGKDALVDQLLSLIGTKYPEEIQSLLITSTMRRYQNISEKATWYDLLAETKEIFRWLWIEKNFRYILDSEYFMNTPSCQWAYIVDLDANVFSIRRPGHAIYDPKEKLHTIPFEHYAVKLDKLDPVVIANFESLILKKELEDALTG